MLNDLSGASGLFAVVRAAHISSCAALTAVFVFERLIAGRCGAMPHRAKIILLSLLAIFITGFAWFVLVTMDMTGAPFSEALSRENIHLMLSTEFGRLWKVRMATLLLGVVAGAIARRYHTRGFTPTANIGFVVSLFLLGSLAWTGHGNFGTHPTLHWIADVIHLLLTAIWPGGLFMLWLMMTKADDPILLRPIVNRFSRYCLLTVFLFIVSGWVNSWMLVGSWRGLVDTTYGQVLLIKIGLFAGMVILGAFNLMVLRPRLARNGNPLRGLKITVAIETVLAVGVMLAVGYLGLLEPAINNP